MQYRSMPLGTLTYFFLIVLLFSLSNTSTAQTAKSGDCEAVLKAVQLLLDGWREADPSKLETALHPDFREVTLHLQDGKWNFATVERSKLIDITGRIEKGSWDDQLVGPQVNVDGPIAVVWAHYRFTVRFLENGVARSPTHCGIETFQLYRTETAWKIINFADTHSDVCSPAKVKSRPRKS
ncbi:MAG: nuclear transport factor 2 family protein [Pyrinomonadaceae bacterium]